MQRHRHKNQEIAETTIYTCIAAWTQNQHVAVKTQTETSRHKNHYVAAQTHT